MRIKKPLIRQAGSAEAFVGSAATGREHHLLYTHRPVEFKAEIVFSPNFAVRRGPAWHELNRARRWTDCNTLMNNDL